MSGARRVVGQRARYATCKVFRLRGNAPLFQPLLRVLPFRRASALSHALPWTRPGQQMRVQVIDLLPAAGSRVHYGAIAGLPACVGHAQLSRQPRNQYKHSTKQRSLVFTAIGKGGYMFARDDQHVSLRRRPNVTERDELVVFIDARARDQAVGDLAKETGAAVVTHSVPGQPYGEKACRISLRDPAY
ncbi:hypothetical protein PSAC2689_160063 [Paraburkholderia sacchari]